MDRRHQNVADEGRNLARRARNGSHNAVAIVATGKRPKWLLLHPQTSEECRSMMRMLDYVRGELAGLEAALDMEETLKKVEKAGEK